MKTGKIEIFTTVFISLHFSIAENNRKCKQGKDGSIICVGGKSTTRTIDKY